MNDVIPIVVILVALAGFAFFALRDRSAPATPPAATPPNGSQRKSVGRRRPSTSPIRIRLGADTPATGCG